MLVRSALRASRQLVSRRTFSTTLPAMAEGATGSGSSRPGGVAQGDAFSKREQASEELYIRNEEKAKLRALMQKLKDNQKNMEDLHKEVESLVADQKGQK